MKAMTGIEVLAVLALIGVVTWLVKPSLLPGASRNAAQSTTATARVEATTHAQDATAAASVVKIGEANATAPASPAKDFISQEVPVALASLPAPDPIALLAAEKRRSAVMEGRADEARKLYETAAKHAAQLQTERDNALAERRAVDLKLETAAAAEHARTVQFMGAAVIALLFAAAWLYAKIYGIHPEDAGRIIASIRGGQDPIQAFDTYLAPRLHKAVRTAAKLATEPTDTP
jgi:type II secretory pathway pseudopilin PulG